MKRRPNENDAALKDVLMVPLKEECAGDMGQRIHQLRPNNAAAKDVQTILSKEECARGMGQRLNDRKTTHCLLRLLSLW